MQLVLHSGIAHIQHVPGIGRPGAADNPVRAESQLQEAAAGMNSLTSHGAGSTAADYPGILAVNVHTQIQAGIRNQALPPLQREHAVHPGADKDSQIL